MFVREGSVLNMSAFDRAVCFLFARHAVNGRGTEMGGLTFGGLTVYLCAVSANGRTKLFKASRPRGLLLADFSDRRKVCLGH
jgi:hypothetical protein